MKRSQFTAENVKTTKRAYMFAILLAIGLARRTIKRRRTTTLRAQEVTVLCGSPTVVDLVNLRRAHGPENLESVRSMNDRSMIKRVLKGIRELLRRRVYVAIAEDGQKSSSKEANKAKTMARQKGRKACRSRRQARRNASIVTETAGTQAGIGVA